MSKNLVIYFSSPTRVSHPYEGLRDRAEARQNDLLSCLPKEINIFICRYEKNYHGDNYFSPEFQRIENRWVEIESKRIHAHLVLGFLFGDKIITNRYPNPISEITQDKSVAPKLFPNYMLEYIVCHNYEELKKNFNTIESALKVMKPITGSGGKGIIIDSHLPKKTDFQEEYFPYILQEFFDTSEGFYNYHGTHDFRVILLDGIIIGKLLRQPPKDTYIANVTSGGSLQDLWDFDIPNEMDKIINEIDTYCSKYKHRYYSIDFGIGKNGEIKIFELNSAPALSTPHIAKSLGNYIVNNLL